MLINSLHFQPKKTSLVFYTSNIVIPQLKKKEKKKSFNQV